MNNYYKKLLAFMLVLLALPAFSAWQVDPNHSTISFISTKKGDVAEVHHFTKFSGDLSAQGSVKVTINLASVSTGIPKRDQRMVEYLFQAAKFPTASFTAKLDQTMLEHLTVGETQAINVSGIIDLHGAQQSMSMPVVVAKLAANKLLITSREPVIIHAADFGLTAGIMKLQSLAALPSISKAVPFSFVLTIEQH